MLDGDIGCNKKIVFCFISRMLSGFLHQVTIKCRFISFSLPAIGGTGSIVGLQISSTFYIYCFQETFYLSKRRNIPPAHMQKAQEFGQYSLFWIQTYCSYKTIFCNVIRYLARVKVTSSSFHLFLSISQFEVFL